MNEKAQVIRRLRQVREDLYGEHGVESLARALGLPVETWLNYERGVTLPAMTLLEFLDLTGTDPHWLFTGDGERHRVQTTY